MKFVTPSTPKIHWLVVTDTELQMIYEALRYAKPYAEMSKAFADIEQHLEARLWKYVKALEK